MQSSAHILVDVLSQPGPDPRPFARLPPDSCLSLHADSVAAAEPSHLRPLHQLPVHHHRLLAAQRTGDRLKMVKIMFATVPSYAAD